MRKKINKIFFILKNNKIINKIDSGLYFHDEPKFYFYTTVLNKQLPSLKTFPYELTAGGLSFSSQRMALVKCLMEAVERYCLLCQEDRLNITSFYKLKEIAIDPSMYLSLPGIRNKDFGWIKGFNLTKKQECWLPAQLVNLHYPYLKKEYLLTTVISTGAASGFDKIETILRGIYEAVERDSFMTIYLNQIKVPRINLKSIGSEYIDNILKKTKRYNLDLQLLDISNDLEIPTFLALLIDRTGIGPALTVGVKSNKNVKEAILGSIEESFMARPWIRTLMINNKNTIIKNRYDEIKSREQRGLLWSSEKMLQNLNYLLDQKPRNYIQITKRKNESSNKELDNLILLLKKKGFQIYIKNITHSLFKKNNYFVFKVIVPNLQPLYLFKIEHNIKRLKQVSQYFGQKKFHITKLPHPFL